MDRYSTYISSPPGVLDQLSHKHDTGFVPPSFRYDEYIFTSSRKQGQNKSKKALASDMSELQVWITSADSECDSYPSVTSDESCEFTGMVFVFFHFSHLADTLIQSDLQLYCICN